MVTQIGAAGNSNATIALTTTSPAGVLANSAGTTMLACALLSSNGGSTSCTSTLPTPLAAGSEILIAVYNFTNLPDFQNARMLVSFTCQ
jgi:hypothetical protein